MIRQAQTMRSVAERNAPVDCRERRERPSPDIPSDPHDVLRFISELAAQGDLSSYQIISGRVFLMNCPALVRHVFHSERYHRSLLIAAALGEGLLTTEGESWLSRRKILQPFFRAPQFETLAPMITGATLEMLERWSATDRADEPIDVAAEMTDLTLRTIIQGLFSVDIGGETSEFPGAVATIIACLAQIGFVQFNLSRHVTVTSRQQFQDAMGLFDRFVEQMVRARISSECQAHDLLSCLLKAYAEPSGKLTADGRRHVRDEIVTLIIAGHETTAAAVTWTWYLLSQHPEIEQRLHRELDTVLAGRVAQIEDLPKLAFLQRVLQESMRIRPPVWFIGRKAIADDVVMGVEVPAGSPVIVSPYTMHRHPEFWPSPEVFDPDRFLPERSIGRAQFAYIPFGGGRHLCIGNHLSMLEARLIIATVAQKFRLRAVDGHIVMPEPLFTLRPQGGLPLIRERR